MCDNPSDAGTASDVLLSEYQSLRAEISQRSTAQGQLAAAAVTITGLGVGAGLLDQGLATASFAIPSLCAVLGLMWIDHAVQIEKIGAYIEEFLAPIAQRLTGDESALSWERVTKVDGPRTPPTLARLGVPILAMGLLPAISPVTLAFATSNAIDSWGEFLLLGIGILFIGSFVWSWFLVVIPLKDGFERVKLAKEMRKKLMK